MQINASISIVAKKIFIEHFADFSFVFVCVSKTVPEFPVPMSE
jgi:hypothetical protein